MIGLETQICPHCGESCYTDGTELKDLFFSKHDCNERANKEMEMVDFDQNEYMMIRFLEKIAKSYREKAEAFRERGDGDFAVFCGSFSSKLSEIIERIRKGEHKK